MHLADFSYTERLLQNSLLLVLFLVHLWLTTRFEDIRLLRRNVKMAVFYLTILSFLGWIVMDLMTATLKYEEWRDPANHCMPKAQSKFSESNRNWVAALKYYFK
jgi:hypothetical protein